MRFWGSALFMVLTYFTSLGLAQGIAPYTSLQEKEIFLILSQALATKEDGLALNQGAFQAETLPEAIRAQLNGIRNPDVGFGNTAQEAVKHAGILCMRTQCQKIDSEIKENNKQFRNFSPEKLADYVQALGKSDLIPNEVSMINEDFKNQILDQLDHQHFDCSNSEQPMLKLVIYSMCMGNGFQVKQNR